MKHVISLKTHEEYTPEWGNKDRKEADKVLVRWHHLSAKEQRQCIEISVNDDGKPESRYNDDAEFCMMTDSIENLIVNLDGKEVEITEGKQVLETCGLNMLYAELKKHYAETDAVDLKN